MYETQHRQKGVPSAARPTYLLPLTQSKRPSWSTAATARTKRTSLWMGTRFCCRIIWKSIHWRIHLIWSNSRSCSYSPKRPLSRRGYSMRRTFWIRKSSSWRGSAPTRRNWERERQGKGAGERVGILISGRASNKRTNKFNSSLKYSPKVLRQLNPSRSL